MESVSPSELFALFGPSILAALVAAGLCGYLGFFVVTRRVAFVSAALGQISGLGVAFGFLLGSFTGRDPHTPTPFYLDPVLIALVLSGVIAALLSTVANLKRTPPESMVAFAYLAASALTLLVLASPRIVQEAHEVGDLLFGNTVAVRHEHLVELIVVAAIVLVSHVFLFKDLLFISFDREMAHTLGMPVVALDLYLHLCVGVVVAVATRAVGALPVFGFLVLPAGAALLAFESVWLIISVSVIGALLAASFGFYLSFIHSLPTGPMMVLCLAAYWPIAGAAFWITRALSRSEARSR
jgi:zinc transport system permease protein